MTKTFALTLVLAAAPVLAQEDLADVNKPAPMFRLPVYNAKAVGHTVVGLDRYVGPDALEQGAKILVISFMASWCEPCKKEMPYLQTLHEKYRDAGLRVMMVSIDTEAEGQKKVEELIELNKVTFPLLKDRFNLVARRWLGTKTALPSLFLVKPDGVVSTVHRGYNEDGMALLAKELEVALGVKGIELPKSDKPVAPVAAQQPAENTVKPAKLKKK